MQLLLFYIVYEMVCFNVFLAFQMSVIQASKGTERKLPVDYWSRMKLKNPGYKILKKIGYDGVSGLGRNEQEEVRALCHVQERIGVL